MEQKNLDQVKKLEEEKHSYMMTAKPKVFKKGGKERYGKGFSVEELKRSGISFKEALRLGVPVDSKRRTAHEENVEAIKTFLESAKAKSKRKRKSKS